ncbi:MAG: hypothetical protein JO165_07515 [Candidatus Eremiobacteraeota bacterium]|nr:hypothetical protein [Candidatus Eremiobacteraeota bacterium]
MSHDGHTLYVITASGFDAIDALTFIVRKHVSLSFYPQGIVAPTDSSAVVYGIQESFPVGFFYAWSTTTFSTLHKIPIQDDLIGRRRCTARTRIRQLRKR